MSVKYRSLEQETIRGLSRREGPKADPNQPLERRAFTGSGLQIDLQPRSKETERRQNRRAANNQAAHARFVERLEEAAKHR